jgi:hypothetical protein
MEGRQKEASGSRLQRVTLNFRHKCLSPFLGMFASFSVALPTNINSTLQLSTSDTLSYCAFSEEA